MSQGYRKSPLPKGWAKLRQQILTRDNHTCQTVDPTPCNGPLEIHHLIAHNYHHPDGLTTLCKHHHAEQTRLQQQHASNTRRNKLTHPKPQHPGLQ